MFGFLKKKLNDVVGKFSKKVDEESEKVEIPKEEVDEALIAEKETSGIEDDVVDGADVDDVDDVVDDSDVGDVVDDVDDVVDDSDVDDVDDVVVDDSDVEEDAVPKRRGFFSKLSDTFTKFKLSEEKFEDLFWDVEVALLENNVAFEVIEKIKQDLKNELTNEKISRKKVNDIILDSLHNSIKEVLSVKSLDLLKEASKKKPYVIVVIGVNGSGKTTTIAKLCNYLKNHKKSVVLAAADTFRAAAIQQIEYHANRLDIKLIKHDYNSDPSAVAFDAVRHAEAKGFDFVVIDTAGRLHSNDNLMNELKKLVRVNKPDLKLFVGESITGNDCVEQAKKYDEIIGIDAIILSKADVDEKGGAALSISYVTKKPVIFIGTGQGYDDLEVFDKNKILKNLGI
ncbi:MAG: signal recognition particle-docking protein FtsY [Candidatus Woesearchaeota archaeon]